MAKRMESNVGRALGRPVGVLAGYLFGGLGAGRVKSGKGKRGAPVIVDALQTLLSDAMSLYLSTSIRKFDDVFSHSPPLKGGRGDVPFRTALSCRDTPTSPLPPFKGGLVRGRPRTLLSCDNTSPNLRTRELRPGISANISYLLLPFEEEGDVPASLRTAKLIAHHLRGVHPQRVGVDGLPGSGKSTLARALAEQMKLEWVCLDHGLFSSAPIDLSRTGVVYEHHRRCVAYAAAPELFRTQDLNAFDALVYLDEPLEIVEKRIISRRRGAAMLDLFDFEQMQPVGGKGLQPLVSAAGEAWQVPDTHVLVKLRPPGGFQDLSRLKAELNDLGLAETGALPKEALLFLAISGQAKRGSLAYLKGRQLLKGFRPKRPNPRGPVNNT